MLYIVLYIRHVGMSIQTLIPEWLRYCMRQENDGSSDDKVKVIVVVT